MRELTQAVSRSFSFLPFAKVGWDALQVRTLHRSLITSLKGHFFLL